MIGRTIGNYQITEELAQGSMGVVYRGRHLSQPREVVVKEVLLAPFPVSTRVQLKARFRRETFIQAQLDHSGIVRVYESFAKGDNYYLVMEYVPGASLSDLLARQGLPSSAQMLYLCKQVLSALEYAHGHRYFDESDVQRTGVIHRDIKPANLLIDGRGKLKLTDFGIVKMPGQQSMAPPSFQPGTFEYMPPEQLRGLDLDARSDIYSLGVTFYEMLTGRLPSGVSSPSGQSGDPMNRRGPIDPPPLLLELRPDLPPALASILTRAILKNPSERFQSASEWLRTINEFERNSGASDAPSRPLVAKQRQLPPEAVTIVELASSSTKAQSVSPAQTDSAFSSTAPVASEAQTAPTTKNRTRQTESKPVVQSAPPVASSRPASTHDIGAQEIGAVSRFNDLNRTADQSSGSGKAKLIALAAGVVLAVVAGYYLLMTSGPESAKKSGGGSESAAAADSTATLPIAPTASAATPQTAPPPSAQRRGDLSKLDLARDADRLGKFNQAAVFYEEYLRSGPDEAEAAAIAVQADKLRKFIAYLNAANAAFSRQDYAAARRNYAEALKLRPYSKLVQSGFARSGARLSEATTEPVGAPVTDPPE